MRSPRYAHIQPILVTGQDKTAALHHCEVIAINGPSYRLKDRANLVNTAEPAP